MRFVHRQPLHRRQLEPQAELLNCSNPASAIALNTRCSFVVNDTPDVVSFRRRPDSGAAPDAISGLSVFTAVHEQLGLKLESRKAPIAMLVIDHAERVPTEN